MTATNHALTGAAIGLTIGQPLLALPLALVSHFVCDALPHFGWQDRNQSLKTSGFRNYLIVEALLCFGLVVLLMVIQPQNWLLAAVCAFATTSPDFLWINKYRRAQKGKTWRPNTFLKWAGDIQWFQRPIGAVVEIAWFVAAVSIIAPFLV